MEQLDLFGTATAIATPAPAAPADAQLALFRPDFAAMRAPKLRGRAARVAAAAAQLDPTLHDGTLI
jgi:hypothetical protein